MNTLYQNSYANVYEIVNSIKRVAASILLWEFIALQYSSPWQRIQFTITKNTVYHNSDANVYEIVKSIKRVAASNPLYVFSALQYSLPWQRIQFAITVMLMCMTLSREGRLRQSQIYSEFITIQFTMTKNTVYHNSYANLY